MTRCPRCQRTDTRREDDHYYRCNRCRLRWDGCDDACHTCGRCKCVCGDDK